jgi:hypothetical protein
VDLLLFGCNPASGKSSKLWQWNNSSSGIMKLGFDSHDEFASLQDATLLVL